MTTSGTFCLFLHIFSPFSFQFSPMREFADISSSASRGFKATGPVQSSTLSFGGVNTKKLAFLPTRREHVGPVDDTVTLASSGNI